MKMMNMPDIGSAFGKVTMLAAVGILMFRSCAPRPPEQHPLDIQLSQKWELQPGDVVSGYPITSGLGDISIHLKGGDVYAPFDGTAQLYQTPSSQNHCLLFSGTDLPAYLLRLCGLKQPRLGSFKAGEAIGSGDYLQFAALRKQPDGSWAIVEPSRSILQKTLSQE